MKCRRFIDLLKPFYGIVKALGFDNDAHSEAAVHRRDQAIRIRLLRVGRGASQQSSFPLLFEADFGVAYMAHVGGFVTGFALTLLFRGGSRPRLNA